MKRASKTVRKERARKASAKRRVAAALAGWLKRMNPGMKTAGAKVQRLKGGVLKVTPIKANISVRKTKKLVKKAGGGTGFWTGKPGAAKLHKIRRKK